MKKVAVSARKPAREKVMITPPMLSSAMPMASRRVMPRELMASAPVSGIIRLSISARSFGLPVRPELP